MKSAGWVLGIVAMMVSFRGPSDALPSRTEREKTAGGLVTLYADDPLTHDFSFELGEHGGTFQEYVRVNTGADIDYGGFYPEELTVGIEGRTKGWILDLGSIDSLHAKYRYEEPVGGGQGFASIRRQGGRFVILRDYRRQTTQNLVETNAFPKSGHHATVVDDHVYLVRLLDEQEGSERFVKILVVSHVPGEYVTMRWELID